MSAIGKLVKAFAGQADTLLKQADEVVQPAASRLDFSAGTATMKQPDYSKVGARRAQPMEKYFDTDKFPKFEGTDQEYNSLVDRHVVRGGMSTEQFAQEVGTRRFPLNPEKYPNLDITPEQIERGDLYTSRKSKPLQSPYEMANTTNQRAKTEEMMSVTTDPEGEFEYHRFVDSEKAGKKAGTHGPGKQLHHRRGLQQYEPFYAGLNEQETVELNNWFRQEGYPVGNEKENLISLTNTKKEQEKFGLEKGPIYHKEKGDSIHTFMRELNLEPKKNQALYKKLVKLMKDKSLNERLPLIMKYLEEVQDVIENKLGSKGSYEKLQDFLDSLGTIPSGPRKGQRMPRNRRTIGDKIIKDLQSNG